MSRPSVHIMNNQSTGELCVYIDGNIQKNKKGGYSFLSSDLPETVAQIYCVPFVNNSIALGQRETELEEAKENLALAQARITQFVKALHKIATGNRPSNMPLMSNAEAIRGLARSIYLIGMSWTIEGLQDLACILDDIEDTSNKCPTCGQERKE